jgi:hypothetical protein
MTKFFLILLLGCSLFASESFKETRYIYSIDKEIHYEGEITFAQDSIKIEYTKPTHQIIDYSSEDENAQKKYFYLIVKSIHDDNQVLLNDFFSESADGNATMLLPKELLGDFIKKVRFKKDKNSLEFLQIYMKNDDWIKIETLR